METTRCMETYQVQKDATTYYVFSNPPQPVWGRPKFRNNVPRPRGVHDYYNLMWDPHVRRGDPLRRESNKKEIASCLKRNKKSKKQKALERGADYDGLPSTPPPVDGRKHFDVQTDNYLEDLEADVVEFDVKTQTEALHELPVAPWFCPAKMGVDESTEILPGDLFDFNLEVKPIVETLVGKIVEQALLEVMEEDELQSLIQQQNEFEERRRLEQLRLFRLQEREQRVAVEKERLMLTMRTELQHEAEAQERVGVNVFSALYLTKATSSAVDSLRLEGFLSAKALISSVFVPWLNCEVEHILAKENLGRALLDDMVRHEMIRRERQYTTDIWLNQEPEPYEYLGEDDETVYNEE